MDFTSPLFLFLFFPVFIVAYLISTQRIRLPLVLAASIVFLIWGQITALWWLTGILVAAYALGLAISRVKKNGLSGKGLLWLGVGSVVALLSFFKFMSAYGTAGLSWLYIPAAWTKPISGLVAPLGLSYVAFQVISYLVDVWKGNTPAEKNFLSLGAYLLFFPKVVSGPLVRYQPFLEQLSQLAPSAEDVAAGLRRLLVGFIKRTLIANQLALVANAVFDLPGPNVKPLFAWLGLIAFALQIFFDFAGYTDMAIGLGMMIGVRLPENFNYPYIAQSASEFWRRWHITLSTWFREYVFFPLERRRLKWGGQQINIVIVFLLTGLWHGFKPTFIVWGLLYGVAIALESVGFGRWLKNVWRPLRHLYTLLIILAGWVFFRSNSLDFAFGFFLRLAGKTSGLTPLPFNQTTPLPFIEPSFVLALIVGIIFSLPLLPAWNRFRAKVENAKAAWYFGFQTTEDILLIAFFILGLAAAVSSTFLPDIYAKF
ncbi:MAG: MBOAT family O-acyltransferase [Anaerolineales bacterium]